METWHRWFALGALTALACEHDARLGFACPGPSASCLPGPAADGGDDALAHDPPTAADSGKLRAQQRREPLSVKIVTGGGVPIADVQLPCGGSCVDVVARAIGGEPPYSYEWDDAVEAPERSLCPDVSAHHTVRVHDSKAASSTAALDLTRSACPTDAGISSSCSRFSVGQYLACGNVGTAGDLPQLRAAQPYTLRIHSNLTSAGDMQVTAVSANCSYSEPLQSFSLPIGPAEQSLCLTPTRDATTLLMTVTSLGGSAAFLTNPDSYVELCGGCE